MKKRVVGRMRRLVWEINHDGEKGTKIKELERDRKGEVEIERKGRKETKKETNLLVLICFVFKEKENEKKEETSFLFSLFVFKLVLNSPKTSEV